MELREAILSRRSGRKYNDQEISRETMELLMQVGLLGASSCNKHPVELIALEGRELLNELSKVRTNAGMLKGANKAIVVISDSQLSDTWIEDGSIAMTNMMLLATELGIANCWIQCQCRMSQIEGLSSGDFVKQLLGIPEKYSVLSILSLGYADEAAPKRTLEDADRSKMHYGKF